MKNNDWYLKQLNITQYTLRKHRFMPEDMTKLVAQKKLIIVNHEVKKSPFIDDIIDALSLSESSYLWLNQDQFDLLSTHLNAVIWLIDNGQVSVDQKLLSHRTMIMTKSLDALMNSSALKRQLWQKLCEYEQYFNA